MAHIVLSESIIQARSVKSIAERLSWANENDCQDGENACWLSRNQLLGQWAHHCCYHRPYNSRSHSVIDCIANLRCDLEFHVKEGRNYPLTKADIDALDHDTALKHADNIASQESGD